MSVSLADRLRSVVGSGHLSTDADVLAGRSVDYTGRYRGHASALVRPGCADQVAAVLQVCQESGAHVTVQGGRTSLVAGTVPHHDDVLLCTDRLTELSAVDETERRVRVGAGVSLAALQRTAAAAGLLFGVDLAARDTATVGGMASTNAGGLHTIRYGNMGEQVLGLQVALPTGELLRRYSRVRRDNTGYDLPALFVGAEGTLGVITEVEVRLHRPTAHRVTAVCGFAELTALLDAARIFADVDGIAALELIDGAATALTDEHLGVPAPVDGTWLLLVEVAADHDPTEALGDALAAVRACGEPAVAVDVAARQRLWRTREAITDVLGVFGPPLKFDVSLPLEEIAGFTARAGALLAEHAPDAIPVLFGHLGEGNLHLNVLRCALTESREHRLDAAMMDLITGCGGNVSSEHGVGVRKREYLGMSRGTADIAAMRTLKAAFDPTGYLNSAVLFS
ncbi:FAD-binding oxidoreductase [Mycolicibacillus parakoreensis]|uniref:FAD-binding oxidoreductase n=1 Tax=Mycolicibacillus parakoreensis TaxID=1069221 RepID=UPI00389903FB